MHQQHSNGCCRTGSCLLDNYSMMGSPRNFQCSACAIICFACKCHIVTDPALALMRSQSTSSHRPPSLRRKPWPPRSCLGHSASMQQHLPGRRGTPCQAHPTTLPGWERATHPGLSVCGRTGSGTLLASLQCPRRNMACPGDTRGTHEPFHNQVGGWLENRNTGLDH